MNSHAIPERLLKQFAYYDVETAAPRLWRYAKGRKPFRKSSPHKDQAVRIDGHFDDPENPDIEATLEKRLKDEIEEPVNAFISKMADPSFVPNESQRKALTRYITVLFNRSKAKREAAPHTWEMKQILLNKFLANEQQLLTVQTHRNLILLMGNRRYNRLFTKNDVIKLARKISDTQKSESAMQNYFVTSVTQWIDYFDDAIFEGGWRLLSTKVDEPFILSDAPIATWDRKATDRCNYGVGFGEPDVEVVFPVSPLTCWHILPKVQRTRPVVTPTTREVNIAQAAFAARCCFSNIEDAAIDQIVQNHISTAKLGVTAFTLWNMNYDNRLYEFFMSDNRWLEPHL
jgi:hypothetical protein